VQAKIFIERLKMLCKLATLNKQLASIVCGTVRLQAGCKLLCNLTRLSCRHGAIYSTLANTALDLCNVKRTD